MSSCATSGQPLTRRQMREMERAAEAASARSATLSQAAPSAGSSLAPTTPAAPAAQPAPAVERTPLVGLAAAIAQPPTTQPTALAPSAAAPVIEEPVERIPMGAVPSDEQTVKFTPLPSRRSLRAAEPAAPAPRSDAAPLTRREMREIHWKPVRGTHVVPRTTLLGALGAATIAVPIGGFVLAGSPAAATFLPSEAPVTELAGAAAAAHILSGEISTGTALREDPRAQIVADNLAARQLARTVITACDAPAVGANGLSEAYTLRVDAPIRPMAEGTYRDTSLFGPRWGAFHYGTDMAAPVGTPLYAVADGTVVHAGEGIEGRSGNLVIVEAEVDGVPTWFWYGHMYSQHVYVQEGDAVSAGQIIAGVGNRGFSTGPHLHFEIHTGEWDNAVDPLVWLDNHSAIFPGQC